MHRGQRSVAEVLGRPRTTAAVSSAPRAVRRRPARQPGDRYAGRGVEVEDVVGLGRHLQQHPRATVPAGSASTIAQTAGHRGLVAGQQQAARASAGGCHSKPPVGPWKRALGPTSTTSSPAQRGLGPRRRRTGRAVQDEVDVDLAQLAAAPPAPCRCASGCGGPPAGRATRRTSRRPGGQSAQAACPAAGSSTLIRWSAAVGARTRPGPAR